MGTGVVEGSPAVLCFQDLIPTLEGKNSKGVRDCVTSLHLLSEEHHKQLSSSRSSSLSSRVWVAGALCGTGCHAALSTEVRVVRGGLDETSAGQPQLAEEHQEQQQHPEEQGLGGRRALRHWLAARSFN
jgi:hypothetical protein